MTPKITPIDITPYLTERCLHFYRRVTQSVSNTVVRYEDAAEFDAYIADCERWRVLPTNKPLLPYHDLSLTDAQHARGNSMHRLDVVETVYFCKTVQLVDNVLPEKYVRAIAHTVQRLYDANLIMLGFLTHACYVSFSEDRVMTLFCVTATPQEGDITDETARQRLNAYLGNEAFVKAGEIGDDDWRCLFNPCFVQDDHAVLDVNEDRRLAELYEVHACDGTGPVKDVFACNTQKGWYKTYVRDGNRRLFRRNGALETRQVSEVPFDVVEVATGKLVASYKPKVES